MPRQREADAFLRELFAPALGGRRDLRIALWEKSRKRSHYYRAAQAAAAQAHGQTDWYVSVSLAAGDLGPGARVRNSTAAGIPGLWADLDVNGGPESKTNAAPTLAAALELAAGVLQPTVTVTSGYGLQAWWLLDEPWIFSSVEERAQAARLAAGWLALLDGRARAAGWRLDATQDLARLMRIPGTVNGKGGLAAECKGWPDPVTEQDGPRYPLDALAELARDLAPAATNGQLALAGDGLSFDPEASPPVDKFMALMENSEMFKRTWRHTRREGAQWSTSEWDLSLASQAAQADWTEDEIAALLAYHRREHGGEKLDRPDYFARTIAKARAEITRTEREREREDALDDLEVLADQTQPDVDATVSAFNRVVGGPQVKEFVQDGRDPATARFTLVMANGDPVRLGRIDALMSQDRFRGAFAVVTGHVLQKVKPAKWDGAVQALLKVRQVRESEDDTPEGTVADWLSRYLYERLAPEPGQEAKDAACQSKEPFEEDGHVHVFAASFGAFVRQALRVNLPDHEIKDMLRAAGFERRTVHYQRDDGRESTRSYYAGPREGIE